MNATKPAVVLRDAAEAALHAAAAQAGKSGVKTTEFWATVLGAGASVALGIVLPTPFGLIAAGAIAAGTAAYSFSRGNVKAALGAAAVNALGAAAKVPGVVGEVAGTAAVVAAAEGLGAGTPAP